MALVSPTGKVGYVNIATGPLSSGCAAGGSAYRNRHQIVERHGGSSIKYFPDERLGSQRRIPSSSKELVPSMTFYLEPTGGIDLENFEEIVQIAVDAGVKIIPHVYSSIIDQETGDTRTEDVKTLLTMMKKTLNK